MYLHPHTRVHVSSSFHPPHLRPFNSPIYPSCPFDPFITYNTTATPLPQILSPHRFSKSLHDRYNKEFGIFYPYRINDIFAQQVSRPPSIPSFIEYLYSNLERTKRGYAFLFIYFFFFLTTPPLTYPSLFLDISTLVLTRIFPIRGGKIFHILTIHSYRVNSKRQEISYFAGNLPTSSRIYI